MATKKINPVNPDAKDSDEVEDVTAERKTASIRFTRKSARKTNNAKCF